MPGEGVAPLGKIEKPNLLLVEGRDDKILFARLVEHLGRRENISVESYGGTAGLRGYLDPLRFRDGFEMVSAIVVVRDADQDCSAALQSVQDALKQYDLPPPQAPLTFTQSSPRVGILIMPCGEETGSLEDMCLQAVSDDVAMPCVRQYLDCLRAAATTAEFGLCSNHSKILVSAFLASRPKPSLKLGEAAGAGIWDFAHPVWQPLIDFLRAM
ncbi:MAG: DUF3226 domain-containing protein [Armatimonadota bacterium]